MASSDGPEDVIKEEPADSPAEAAEPEPEPPAPPQPAEVKTEKAVLINSSTSPSLPELPAEETKTDDEGAKYEPQQVPYQEDAAAAPENGADSAQMYSSNAMESVPVEVAQTNFNESETSGFNESVGAGTTCVNDSRDNPVPYQVNYPTSANVPGASEYGSQPASSGAYMNSSVG